MIDDKYAELGGPAGFLGPPVTPEFQTPNGLGFCRHYQNNGSIYWKTSFPFACEVHGLIRQKWAELGWETSPVGFPVTDEKDVLGKPGRTNTFESGVISWTPATGAHEVHGAILGRWLALGREAGFGFPLTDELVTPGGRGRYNHFEGGSIYWTGQTGAVEVKGAVKDVWAAGGWEQGPLGFPTAPEGVAPPGGITIQDFERGYLCMQTNLAAFSRTVLQPPTVIALPVIMIGWGAFSARLPDGDLIAMSLGPAKNPNSAVTLTLNAGPAVTWFKGVGLWSVSRGTIALAFTQDAKKTSSVTLQPADTEKNDAFIVFEKAKLFGVHTGMYWLTPTRRILGHDVTFTWTAD